MYVEYSNNTLGETRNPQQVETKLSDGTALGRPADGWQDRQLETLGLYPVAHVDMPDDTATATHVRTVELGTPGDPTTATVVWTARDFTAEELADQAASAETAAAKDVLNVLIADVASGNQISTQAGVVSALRALAERAADDTP